jgi:hypothetical protein
MKMDLAPHSAVYTLVFVKVGALEILLPKKHCRLIHRYFFSVGREKGFKSYNFTKQMITFGKFSQIMCIASPRIHKSCCKIKVDVIVLLNYR